MEKTFSAVLSFTTHWVTLSFAETDQTLIWTRSETSF